MRVSVVINNYNYAAYVGAAVESALAQDYADMEVIVVDDGSTDHSAAVLADYADRITLIHQHNQGQGAAVNHGFRAASGDIMLFLDADDGLLPGAVAQIVAAWQAGCSKVHFALNRVDQHLKPLGKQWPNGGFASGDMFTYLASHGYYPTPPMSGNAFSRTYLQQVLPMPAQIWPIAADAYLNGLAPLYGPVIALDKPLGFYRQHGANASEVSGRSRQKLAERVRWQRQVSAAAHGHATQRGIELPQHYMLRRSSIAKQWLLAQRLGLMPDTAGRWPLLKLIWKQTWQHPTHSWWRRLYYSLGFAYLSIAPCWLLKQHVA